MKLSRHDFRGTGKVFAFTLKQLFCNKANVISLFVTCLLLFLSMPLLTLLGREADSSVSFGPMEEAPSTIEADPSALPTRIYVKNDTPITFAYPNDGVFASINYIEADFPADAYRSNLSPEDGWLHLFLVEDGFHMDYAIPGDENHLVADAFYRALDAARMTEAGAALSTPYAVSRNDVENYGEESLTFTMDTYFVQLFYSIIVMLVSLYASAYIVQSVVEEKTSKLVETLMISVKPLALILGKILAAMLYVFAVVLINVIAAILSSVVNHTLLDGAAPTVLLAELGVSLDALQLSPITLVVVLISLFLGYLTYSLIAGMSGAGCAQAEDVQPANSTAMFLVMLCYMAALFTSSIQAEAVSMITSLLPFLSIFCAPVHFMTGAIGLPVLLGSWLIQAVVIVFLAWTCAKIYEDLIIYKGKRIPFTAILKMAWHPSRKGGENA